MAHAMVRRVEVPFWEFCCKFFFLFPELASQLRRRGHHANERDHGGEERCVVWRRNASASAAPGKARRVHQNRSSAEAAAVQHGLHGGGAEADVDVLQHAVTIGTGRRHSKAERPGIHRERNMPKNREMLHRRCVGALRPDEFAVVAVPVAVPPSDDLSAPDGARRRQLWEALRGTNASDASGSARRAFAGWSLYGERRRRSFWWTTRILIEISTFSQIRRSTRSIRFRSRTRTRGRSSNVNSTGTCRSQHRRPRRPRRTRRPRLRFRCAVPERAWYRRRPRNATPTSTTLTTPTRCSTTSTSCSINWTERSTSWSISMRTWRKIKSEFHSLLKF